MTFSARRSAAAFLICAAGIVPTVLPAGPGTPGPAYFTGVYERVGRDAAAAQVNDLVRIEPDGVGLSLTSCTAGPVRLSFAPWALGENFLAARIGEETLVCQFHNNGDNHPILTCQSDKGAKLTLWPGGGASGDDPLGCAPGKS